MKWIRMSLNYTETRITRDILARRLFEMRDVRKQQSTLQLRQHKTNFYVNWGINPKRLFKFAAAFDIHWSTSRCSNYIPSLIWTHMVGRYQGRQNGFFSLLLFIFGSHTNCWILHRNSFRGKWPWKVKHMNLSNKHIYKYTVDRFNISSLIRMINGNLI